MPPIRNNPFVYKGRIGRVSFIINTIVIWVLAFFAAKIANVSWDPFLVWGMWILLAVLYVLAYFAAIKRLRDIKKSVWLSLVMIFPIANIVFEIVLFFLPSEWKEEPPAAPAAPNAPAA